MITLDIINTLKDRFEVRKKMIQGQANTEEWCRVINVQNANYGDSLTGYYNMLSCEDQIIIHNLMMERPFHYVYELSIWESFMPAWQLSAVRIMS